MLLRRNAVFFLLMILLISIGTDRTYAQTCTVPGTRPATADDDVVKNNQIALGTCYNPNDRGVTQPAAAAKAYLNTLPKRPLSQCAPPNQENINKLNDAFAICAARFFKEYTQRYGTVYITSAYRDGPSGANKCAGGAEGSNHTRALAMDVNPANESQYPTMWKFASDNPQFGVCFPFQDGRTGSIRDRPHMILAGIGGSEGALCAKQNVTKACDGSNFDPNSVRSASAAPTTPTSQLLNTVRQALGMQQPALAPLPQLPQQALPAQQSPTNAFTSPTSASLLPVSTLLGTVTASSSVADRLEQLAFGSTATTTRSATSVPIIINGKDTGGIQSTQTQTQQTVGSGSGTIAQNTFVSGDLNQVGPSSIQQTSTQQVLSQIKASLLSMLQYLQPFRSWSPSEDGRS